MLRSVGWTLFWLYIFFTPINADGSGKLFQRSLGLHSSIIEETYLRTAAKGDRKVDTTTRKHNKDATEDDDDDDDNVKGMSKGSEDVSKASKSIKSPATSKSIKSPATSKSKAPTSSPVSSANPEVKHSEEKDTAPAKKPKGCRRLSKNSSRKASKKKSDKYYPDEEKSDKHHTDEESSQKYQPDEGKSDKYKPDEGKSDKDGAGDKPAKDDYPVKQEDAEKKDITGEKVDLQKKSPEDSKDRSKAEKYSGYDDDDDDDSKDAKLDDKDDECDDEPAPTPEPNTPAPAIPSIEEDIDISLAPYFVLYEIQQTRIPLLSDYDELTTFTSSYLDTYFRSAFASTAEIEYVKSNTALLGSEFRLAQPVRIDYATNVTFTSTSLIPGTSELAGMIVGAFEGENGEMYAANVAAGLGPNNIFATTSSATYSLAEAMPSRLRFSQLGTAIYAINTVLIAIVVLVYRRRSKRESPEEAKSPQVNISDDDDQQMRKITAGWKTGIMPVLASLKNPRKKNVTYQLVEHDTRNECS